MIPGVVALVEWLLAAVLYAVGWYRRKSGLNRFGDSLVVAGLVTALGGAAWLVWAATLSMGLTRGSLATGLAGTALIVYGVLAYWRNERLTALAMLGFAIPIQGFAITQWLWLGLGASLPVTFLPLWTALRTLTGLVGYGALAMSAMMILVSFVLTRTQKRLSVDHLAVAIGLPVLEWRSWQIALVALSLSLSFGLIRTWYGLGQVIAGGMSWMLITWLLLAASAYGQMQGVAHHRSARALLVIAGVAGVVSVLTMAGPLVGTS